MPNTKSQDNKKGKGWHGDQKAHARVGQLGGQATAKTHDETFYSQIGRLGGQVSPGNFANDPERARQAGRKGGKARGQKVRKSV